MRVRLSDKLAGYISLLDHGFFLLSQETKFPVIPNDWGPHIRQRSLRLSPSQTESLEHFAGHWSVSGTRLIQAALYLAATKSRLQPVYLPHRAEVFEVLRAGGRLKQTSAAKTHGHAAALFDQAGELVGYVPANTLASLPHQLRAEVA